MNDSKTIESGVIFQGDNNQILCLAGRTLTVKLAVPAPYIRIFNVSCPLTIEDCKGGGELTVTGGPINVYEPLTLTETVPAGMSGSREGICCVLTFRSKVGIL